MRSFTESKAPTVFLDSTSPLYFSTFLKYNSNMEKESNNPPTFSAEESKTFYLNQGNDLVASNDDVSVPSSSSKPDEKKMKRVLANRRSARESYQRRKKMFAELESTVNRLTKDNAELADENKKLRRQVMSLHQQLGLSLLPSSLGGNSLAGMSSNSLAIQQLQNHQVASHQLPSQQTLAQQQQQLAQQQGELDQLLELILKGRGP